MQFLMSRHAEREIARRCISRDVILAVLSAPEQRLPDDSGPGLFVYQSRILFETGRLYLVRVVVAENQVPPVVVTAYRTSKIAKYWSVE
jgi:hypothetical protein